MTEIKNLKNYRALLHELDSLEIALQAKYTEKTAALLERKRNEVSAAISDVENTLSKLNPQSSALLRYHYIDGLTWVEIATTKIYISIRQLHNWRKEALAEYERERTI